VQTTHLPNKDWGSITITHPFHPLRGQTLKVLKTKKMNGTRIFSVLSGEEIVAVRETWIQQDPFSNSLPSTTTLYALPSTLVELIELLKNIQQK
jgi:hypothetical protein